MESRIPTLSELINLYPNRYERFYCRIRCALLPMAYINEFLPDSGTIIDFGCSKGIMANYLAMQSPERQILGVDIREDRIAVAKKSVNGRDNIQFLNKDATMWDIPPCGGVIMLDFLHHLPYFEQGRLLHRIYNSLENGGMILIEECNTADGFKYRNSYLYDALFYRALSNFRHIQEWNRILTNIGFSLAITKVHNPIFSQILIVGLK